MNEDLERKRISDLIDFYIKIRNFTIDKKINKPKANLKDISYIILTNDINEFAKSIICLYDNKSIIGISSMVRISFERLLFLNHIIKKSSYAAAYYYSLQLTQLNYILNIEKDGEFLEKLARLLGKNTQELLNEVHAKFNRIDEQKKRDDLIREYKNCFDYDLIDKDLFKKNWYDFDGKTPHLRELANKLRKHDEYLVNYEFLSSEIHSTTLGPNYVFDNIENEQIIGILDDKTNLQNNQLLTYMNLILLESIEILIKIYNLPLYFKKELRDILLRTINPNNLLRK